VTTPHACGHIDRNLSQRLYRRLLLRPHGYLVGELADYLQVTEGDVITAIRHLSDEGLVELSEGMVTPVPVWDMDRLDLFLNVPSLPDDQFLDYCAELDDLVKDLRGKDLPVLRPYTNETLVEVLLAAGAAGTVAAVAASVSFFVARITRSEAIPHVELTATRRTRDGAELIFSVKASTASEAAEAFRPFVSQLAHDSSMPESPSMRARREHGRTPAIRQVVPGHAFISYVREDSHQVERLQRMLEAAGIRVWLDTDDLSPGQDWRTEIRRAITDNALVFIACFSQAGLSRDKSFQNEELTLAIEQLRLRPLDDPWLIPVRLDECDIPDRDIGGGRTLNSIQRCDLFGDRFDEGSANLVAAILRILGRHANAAG
jgi:hypothetical protein